VGEFVLAGHGVTFGVEVGSNDGVTVDSEVGNAVFSGVMAGSLVGIMVISGGIFVVTGIGVTDGGAAVVFGIEVSTGGAGVILGIIVSDGGTLSPGIGVATTGTDDGAALPAIMNVPPIVFATSIFCPFISANELMDKFTMPVPDASAIHVILSKGISVPDILPIVLKPATTILPTV